MKHLTIVKLACCLFVLLPLFGNTQEEEEKSVYSPGFPAKGKIRVTKEHIGYRDRQTGDEHAIGFRMFTVDSVQPGKQFFGNHYSNLKTIVKQDPEASIYLINATHWERNQRIFIGLTAIGVGIAAFAPLDSKSFNTMMYIDLGALAGVAVCCIAKRHWANKSIRTWNAHLDERKYVFTP